MDSSRKSLFLGVFLGFAKAKNRAIIQLNRTEKYFCTFLKNLKTMRKIYFFLVATILIGTQAFAQMPKTAIAMNYYGDRKLKVPGGMMFTTHGVRDSSRLIISTTTLVEKFDDERGLALQTYAGLGLANLKRTIGGGVDIGVANSDFDMNKTELSYAAWGYAQTNNGKWQLWFIYMKTGYFVEVWRCMDFATNKKCESFFGLTNFEGNFALTWKTYLVDQKLYAFAGYAIKVYEEEHTSHGVEYSMPKNTLRYPGVHLEIGYEIPHRKNECQECK